MTLREMFYAHEGNLVHKWDHYFDIYEKHFGKYRGKQVNILEIGISHGGSMQLWKKYFGSGLHIYAIDINPDCKKLEEENTTIFIGSQSDRAFLENVSSQIPDLDIIIDDGGHIMEQQLVSFQTLFGKVKEGGVYLVEDTHTSYWTEFYGGLRKPGTFIEYSKSLVDTLYESHIHDPVDIRYDEITRNISCISFYDSVVVFDKEKRKTPFHKQIGNLTITPYVQVEKKKETFWESFKTRFKPKRQHSFEKNDGGFVR